MLRLINSIINIFFKSPMLTTSTCSVIKLHSPNEVPAMEFFNSLAFDYSMLMLIKNSTRVNYASLDYLRSGELKSWFVFIGIWLTENGFESAVNLLKWYFCFHLFFPHSSSRTRSPTSLCWFSPSVTGSSWAISCPPLRCAMKRCGPCSASPIPSRTSRWGGSRCWPALVSILVWGVNLMGNEMGFLKGCYGPLITTFDVNESKKNWLTNRGILSTDRQLIATGCMEEWHIYPPSFQE